MNKSKASILILVVMCITLHMVNGNELDWHVLMHGRVIDENSVILQGKVKLEAGETVDDCCYKCKTEASLTTSMFLLHHSYNIDTGHSVSCNCYEAKPEVTPLIPKKIGDISGVC